MSSSDKEDVMEHINEKFNIFDRAAKKDVHWWFFALLMIGMVAIGFLYTDMRKERSEMRVEITTIRESQLSFVTAKNEALMAALINNTKALEANTHAMQRIEASTNRN